MLMGLSRIRLAEPWSQSAVQIRVKPSINAWSRRPLFYIIVHIYG